jgi:hypothetical protein
MDDLDVKRCISMILDAAGIGGADVSGKHTAVVEALEKYISDLAESSQNFDVDKQRIQIHGRHVALKSVIWEVLLACSSLLSTAAGGHVPAKVVTETAVVMAVANISRKIKRLDSFQLELLRAVARISEEKAKRHKVLQAAGATLQEVKEFLLQHGVDCPADLEARVNELVPDVLSKTRSDPGDAFYLVVQ